MYNYSVRRIIPFILIFILSFFTWKTLLNKGYFSMHDVQQVVRLQQMDKSLKAGQFPVRWVEDLGFGYGYPVFNFYPPFIYYSGEVIHLAGFGFTDSIKIIWFLALFGSAVSMYFLGKEFFGKWGGLTASMFYLYAPYHAVDAYVRGALAELSSFVWLPLILLFSYKKKFVLTGIFLGLLMITHNLIFLPFVGIYILWSIAFRRNFIFPIIIAFGITAFFWMPSLWEKQFTLVDQILTKNLALYKIHFLCPQQLWYSPWGFGGSTANCFDGMSYSLGKIYYFAILVGLIVGIIKKSWISIVSFALLSFSIFMTLPYSQFIWDIISPLWYLQFPWRFLEFAALFSALLAGSLNKKLLVILLIPLVIFTNAKYFVPQKLLPEATDQTQLSDFQLKWVTSSTSYEYLPKGMEARNIDEFTIKNSQFIITKGDFEPRSSQFFPDSFEMQGFSKSGGEIQFQTVNFPGWKVWINGKEVTIDDNNPRKLITVKVESGESQIQAKFTNTPVRTIGNLISMLSIASLIIYSIKRYVVKK